MALPDSYAKARQGRAADRFDKRISNGPVTLLTDRMVHCDAVQYSTVPCGADEWPISSLHLQRSSAAIVHHFEHEKKTNVRQCRASDGQP